MRRAGSIGGAAEACCLQPIDVIKTRLQLDHVGKYKGVVLLLVDAAEYERCTGVSSTPAPVMPGLQASGIVERLSSRTRASGLCGRGSLRLQCT